MVNCLGIYRELQNSPGRESDDALILKAVMEQLSIIKVRTSLMTPEEADQADLTQFDMIVPMCETYPRLKRLMGLKKTLMCNRPESVLGAYRVNMIESFSKDPTIRLPQTEIHPINSKFSFPSFGKDGIWVKRGDVHNTCAHDVVFARDQKELSAVVDDFKRREINDVVLQKHIDGDLIKFYGVGPRRWFTWFYHDPQSARRFQFELDDLAEMAAAGASAVSLEIFGGDAIVTPDGTIYLIDINSWPSFAKVRSEAAIQIAWQLRTRLRRLAK